MHHLESFKWKPGTQSPNPNGRPLKLATILKRQGITQTQCNDLILQILSMTRNEIQSLALDETAPMIERIISNALLLLNCTTKSIPRSSIPIKQFPR